jgi:hypothetical protein
MGKGCRGCAGGGGEQRAESREQKAESRKQKAVNYEGSGTKGFRVQVLPQLRDLFPEAVPEP